MKTNTSKSTLPWDKFFYQIGISLSLPLLLLLLWIFLASGDSLVPPFTTVFATLAALWSDGSLVHDLALSLPRFFFGFLGGALAGFLFGLGLGYSSTIQRLLGGTFHAVRQIPLVGWIPLVILWLGIGENSKLLLIALGSFFPMTLNTFAGIRSVPHAFFELAKIQQFSRAQLILRILLPAAVPYLRTGSLLALNMAWIFVVVSETLTETSGGLSNLLTQGRETYRMDLVILGVLLTGIMGFLLNLLLKEIWQLVLHRRPDLITDTKGKNDDSPY